MNIYDKALEDLEIIESELVTASNNAYTAGIEDVDVLGDNFKRIQDALQYTKKQLEAPTSDEVCHDIEYWLYKCIGKSDPYIKYVDKTKSFVYECDGEFKDLIVFEKGYVDIKKSLPPYIIETIGRFYEKELSK